MTRHQTYNQVNPHTIHTPANTKPTNVCKTHSLRDNITPPFTKFEQTKQIIMDIDKLSHSTTLCNKMLQSLNLNGWCKYDNSHQTYLYEHSNKPVNYSYILIFLKQSACYTLTPDTCQLYRTSTNKITDNHNIAICNDTTITWFH